MLTATWERNNNPNGLFEAGTILEASGQYEQAADLYGQVAAVELLADSADVTQVAARHLRRLEAPANQFFASVEELEHAVWKAVSSRQGGELVALASKTHFAARTWRRTSCVRRRREHPRTCGIRTQRQGISTF
jgi:hypothetical protein